MKILIKFLAAVSDYTGIHKTELEVDNDEIRFGEILKIIREKYPGLKDIEKKVPIIILLNGRKPSPDDIVREGDKIAFLPPISGG